LVFACLLARFADGGSEAPEVRRLSGTLGIFKIMKLIKRHFFLTYGLFALILQAIIAISGAQYDGGGLGGFLIITSAIWGFIYWAPNELIFTLNNSVSIEGHSIISIIIGLGICLGADYLLNFIIKRRSEKSANT
jgi:hypothetical protein